LAAGAIPDFFTDLDLRRRIEHFRTESTQLVPAAAAALTLGDIPRFAAATAYSQTLAENLLGNQVPETSALVALAKECGSLASSAFGAGFGGAVWALIPECDQSRFTTSWLAAYHRRFPQRQATVHHIRPGVGIHSFS
jgi:galactokinase